MLETVFTGTFPAAQVKISVKACNLSPRDLIGYQDKENLARLCAEGCPDYRTNWSCPPYSPAYADYAEKYQHLLLAVVSCDFSQFNHLPDSEQKARFANTVLRWAIEKPLCSLEKKYSGWMLSSGICRLCTLCSCREEAPCKRPKEMRYSMESLGLHVSKICEDLLNHRLDWYSRGQTMQHISAVASLLTNTQVDEKELLYTL